MVEIDVKMTPTFLVQMSVALREAAENEVKLKRIRRAVELFKNEAPPLHPPEKEMVEDREKRIRKRRMMLDLLLHDIEEILR